MVLIVFDIQILDDLIDFVLISFHLVISTAEILLCLFFAILIVHRYLMPVFISYNIRQLLILHKVLHLGLTILCFGVI